MHVHNAQKKGKRNSWLKLKKGMRFYAKIKAQHKYSIERKHYCEDSTFPNELSLRKKQNKAEKEQNKAEKEPHSFSHNTTTTYPKKSHK